MSRIKIITYIMLMISISSLIYIVSLNYFCECEKIFSLSCQKIIGLSDFYAENMRGHLFAGFLALGGFLLSLKTFIIVNMKENVYESPEYIKRWRSQSKLSNNPKNTLYGPLKELSDLLFYSILTSILAASSQMTIGLYHNYFATIFCLTICLLATILLIDSLLVIKRNLNVWIDDLA